MAKINKSNTLFWTSYSDLMTSLFFIMLVLFVLVVVTMKGNQKKIRRKLNKYEQIHNIDRYFKELKENKNFKYLPSCKKFVLKDILGIELFKPNSSIIKSEYEKRVLFVGKLLENFLYKLSKDQDLSFSLIIEGNMANYYDYRINIDSKLGYYISYQRALSVYQLWRKHRINLRKYNTEILICGSGYNGICRDNIEDNNKRFTVQIIPRIAM